MPGAEGAILCSMASHAEHYATIENLLAPWSDLWGYSVLHRFKEMERLIPLSWFEFGAGVELSHQFAVGQGQNFSGAPDSLLGWIAQIRASSALPSLARKLEVSSWYERGLTPKKRHEVSVVLGFFKEEGVPISRYLISAAVRTFSQHLARTPLHR